MTTSDDSIVAFIKEVRAQDRRADRERIAELERDLAALRARLLGGSDEEELSKVSYNAYIDVFSGEIDRLTEKCAALVVERDRLAVDNNRLTKSLGVGNPYGPGLVDKAPTLRIDTDMSDPQPGKLLVVRVNIDDCVTMPANWINEKKRQEWVGFLVETPAVDVKRTPKVGDKVRIIDGANAGETATVRAIDSIDPDCFCLMLANGERWFAHVDNLEVIE